MNIGVDKFGNADQTEIEALTRQSDNDHNHSGEVRCHLVLAHPLLHRHWTEPSDPDVCEASILQICPKKGSRKQRYTLLLFAEQCRGHVR